ncbi:hypothetical protein CYMTET_36191, partial [Cymbomonas tetramitiformis]
RLIRRTEVVRAEAELLTDLPQRSAGDVVCYELTGGDAELGLLDQVLQRSAAPPAGADQSDQAEYLVVGAYRVCHLAAATAFHELTSSLEEGPPPWAIWGGTRTMTHAALMRGAEGLAQLVRAEGQGLRLHKSLGRAYDTVEQGAASEALTG